MKLRVIFLLVLVGLALTGCRGAKTGAETAVSFAVFGDLAELAAYEALVDAFHAEQSQIAIQLQHVPQQSTYRQRLATAFAGGDPPDVMLLNYRRFAAFAGEGGLEPLGPYLARSGVIAEGDFYAQAVAAFRWQGQLWCVPQNVSSLVVYYNRDLFDAAGVPYPAADWTHADFLAAARALTVDGDGDGRIDQYGAGIAPNLFRLAPLIWQFGGELVDDPAQPTRLDLLSPPALAALQWLVDLQVVEGVVPDAQAEAAETSERRFMNGRLAMYFNSRRGVPTYRTISAFQWDVAPLPRGVETAGILHSDGYCLAEAAAHKEAAWTFIEFANSPTGQAIVARSGRTVPSLRAVAESAAFLDPSQPPQNSRVFIYTLPTLRTVPTLPGWAAVERMAGEEVERAFYGQIGVREAAETAVVQTEGYFGEK